ncbi:hypothetical protein C0991_010910 [Blastosporella zonata]|nr:hypothetical protein C0991_010910 [Blastosporella zonata]
MPGNGKGTGDDFDAVKRTAEISWNIRQALRAALPAPREQFFTVMVPGKVVNFADYSEGFDMEGNPTAPILPTVTELNQAILCDDMPALAPVQLGPTGKSVARSYDAAISKLVPAGTTVGVDVKDANNLTEEEARYKRAMEWLTYADPENKDKTRVELYTEKQRSYTKIVEQKTKAFNDALNLVKEDPRNTSLPLQRAAYDVWVSENARSYRNLMQGAYMDWVVTGKKEEVEYWFSIVDRDSAMARVEASKSAMRVAVVQDTDGSVEYQKVRLEPSDWAIKAKRKALSGKNQTRTVEWYTWEITRLQKMNGMLTALKNVGKKQLDIPSTPGPASTEQKELSDAMADFIDKREAWQIAAAKKQVEPLDLDESKKEEAYNDYKDARKKVNAAEAKLGTANIQGMNAQSTVAQDKMYNNLQGDSGLAATEIERNNAQISSYETLRDALIAKSEATPTPLVNEIGEEAGIPKSLPDPQAASLDNDEDYFTAITVEIESASSTEKAKSHASASSFGASAGWGWWSASASASVSNASTDTEASMAKNSCKISFECMRVDIQRNWLRAELFYDADLTTGPDEFISPGFGKLRDLMEDADPSGNPETIEKELERYSTFPMYPTAFLLAANVVLELTGETTDVQTSFQQSSVSGGGSFGYGPFRISSSYSQSDSSSSASCDTTADGCRITIKSPQIIGWVSQMVPALPRLRNQTTPT